MKKSTSLKEFHESHGPGIIDHHPDYYPMEGELHDPEITVRQLSDVLISVNGDRMDQTFISYYSSATADVRRQFDQYYKVYFKLHKKR